MKDVLTSKLEEMEFDEDNEEMEKDFDKFYHLRYLLPIGQVLAAKKVQNLFKDFAANTDFMNPETFTRMAIMRDIDLESQTERMIKLSAMSSIDKNDDGAKIWIPVIENFPIVDVGSLSPSSSWIRIPPIWGDREGKFLLLEKILNRFEKLFGKDIYDIDKSVDYVMPVKKSDWSDTGVDPKLIDEEESIVDDVMDSLESMRFAGLAARPDQQKRKIRNLKDIPSDVKGDALIEAKVELLRVRKFTLFLQFSIGNDTINFATQTREGGEARVIDLHNYVMASVSSSCNMEDLEFQFKPMNQIREETAGMIKTKRWNENNLAIEKDGVPIYIPDVDRIDEYDRTYEQTGEESKEFGWSLLPTSKGWSNAEDDPRRQVNNAFIYTDAAMSKLAYMSEGEFKVRDLNRTIDMRPQHVFRFLSTNVNNDIVADSLEAISFYCNKPDFLPLLKKVKIDKSWFTGMLTPNKQGLFYELLEINASEVDDEKALKDAFEASMNKSKAASGFIKNFLVFMSRAELGLQSFMRFNENYEPDDQDQWLLSDYENLTLLDISPDSRFPPLRPLGQYLQLISKELMKDPIKYLESRSIDNGMIALGTAQIIKSYMKDIPALKEKHDKFIESIRPGTPSPDWKAPALPGTNVDFNLLPHQGGLHQKISNNPPIVMLAVSAGGGKTLMALTKLIQMMDEKVIRKPIIICPNYLIANYVEDMISLNNQKYNLVPITRTSLATHGEERIAAILANAPSNTLFITDFHFVKGRTEEVSYGNSLILQGANLELLKTGQFDAAVVDESHFAKNETSQITIATAKLLSTINTIYVMSGTIIDGMLTDLVAQVSLMDPTIFGDITAFIREYALEYTGNKVTIWKQGAEEEIRKRLENNIAYRQVKKKEWSALLPNGIENFYPVDLTENQMKIYNSILEEILDEVSKDAALMKMLKQDDDDDAPALEMLLKKYLARLEQFLTAPTTDPLGSKLKGKDSVSPKALQVVELIEQHINSNDKGKMLVFTSFNRSADEIYRLLPEDIKSKAILYKVAKKAEYKARFMGDDNIRVMIGVETSLNTGHNFQNVSHLIRVESPWNPGTLEQAESRIFRPDVKNKYDIQDKILSWVIASNTIDVTKMARLIFKIVSKVKFEENFNPMYENLPTVPFVSMGYDSIAEQNSFDDALSEHLEAYNQLRSIIQEEYKVFRNDPKTLKDNFKVPSKEMSPDAAQIANIPYIENHKLPFMDSLGLLEVSAYASERNETSSDIDLKGLHVHTEFGDGIVTRSNMGTVSIKTRAGVLFQGISKTKIFIFEDQKAASKSKKEISSRIAKLKGLRTISLSDSIIEDAEIIEDTEVPDKKEKGLIPNTDLIANKSANLYAFSLNGQVTLGVDNSDPDVLEIQDKLFSQGFESIGPYYHANITNKMQMTNLVDFLIEAEEKGNIHIPGKMMKELMIVSKVFQKNRNMAKIIDKLTQKDLRIYGLMRRKKPKNPKTIHVYFAIEDDELFVVIDNSIALRGKQLVKRKIKGITWEEEEQDLIKVFRTIGEAKSFLKDFNQIVPIGNLKEVKAELKSLKVRKRKDK